MHYPDLAAYDYLPEEHFTDREPPFGDVSFRPAYARLAVGWLAAGRPYPVGPVPAALTRRLAVIGAVQRVNLCLGYHECDLCPPGQRPPEGNGELRVPGAPGVAYAAPVLIGHYVTGHGYRPPPEFVAAVLAVDVDAWSRSRWPELPFPWIPADAKYWDWTVE
ncbi:DUF7919 family protein [Micromonospora auratinigra]|uniref:DUF7919 domain-containing protein n=1 Tax=Micromonospora auratinigra TaxID=261654 RepID=A0A1A8ZG35_9ACTN|nr:hypothetical protein GA0070611_2090 [Micromonospora auratinigra]